MVMAVLRGGALPGFRVRRQPDAISQDGFLFTDHPEAVAAFRAGQALLENLACDVLVTPHPGASRLWERVAGAPEGLIDTGACRQYAATAGEQLERERQ